MVAVAGPAAAQQPISAIDWLGTGTDPSRLPRGLTAVTPSAATPAIPVLPDEPAVARSVIVPEVTTMPLDAPRIGAVGLLPRAVTGLPSDLWLGSQSRRLIRMIDGMDVAPYPAMQALLYTLLLTEAEPPRNDGDGLNFLLARIDALTELGAVEPALALAERADPTAHAALFGRWFDLTLLAGDENRACQDMIAQPTLAPSVTALAFCRARLGDWDTAALTFGSAAALGVLPKTEETLLRLYLDPDLADETPPLPPPAQMTPLAFRLSESIGQPIPATGLRRAYANSDLRGISGWRAEIEAAERLARSGALAENRLLGIYTARDPAASGGIWDRVDLIQQLDTAIADNDPDAVSEVLPDVWQSISRAGLELPIARLWGADLAAMELSGPAASIATDLALLGPDYETLARSRPATRRHDAFLAALAAGTPGDVPAPDALTTAIARGFQKDAEIPATIRLNLAQKQLGEAILAAMSLYISGAQGETKDIAPALATFRAVGLEDAARRAALQLMILDRRT